MKFASIFCLLLLVFVNVTDGKGQAGLVAHYSFDNCDVEDDTGMNMPGLVSSALDCECGVVGSGMELGNGLDSINFPSNLTSYFNEDFTLSFYVKFDGNGDRVDILSMRTEDCQVDSSFIIRYRRPSQQIAIEIGEDFNDVIDLKADLDVNVCWHHIVFSKKDQDYFLFYNEELVDQQKAVKVLTIDPLNNLAISSSACLTVLDDPFIGVIDEIKLFDRFLAVDELVPLAEFPDQIINRDTTIFLGDGIQIETGESCSSSPSWTPILGVSDPTILDPFLTPEVSTTYRLNVPGATCSTSDTIRINVIDPDLLECENLLLPNAFTPNGDNLNDVFGISNEFIIEKLDQFEIYDRWGEIVFSTDDKNAKWDGMFKSKKVNPAMFLYVVSYTCRGEEFNKFGNVSVLR